MTSVIFCTHLKKTQKLKKKTFFVVELDEGHPEGHLKQSPSYVKLVSQMFAFFN